MQYVGETSRSLSDRFSEHKSAITLQLSTPIGIHFNSTNHDINDLCILPIEKMNSDAIETRRIRETYWQNELQTIYPTGLNCMPTHSTHKRHPADRNHDSAYYTDTTETNSLIGSAVPDRDPATLDTTVTNEPITSMLASSTHNPPSATRKRTTYIGRKPHQRRKYKAIKASSKARDMIFNLSNTQLNFNEINLLNKGLNFCPASKPTKEVIDKSLNAFERRLQIIYHFYVAQSYSGSNTDYNYRENIVKVQSKFQPKHQSAKISKFVNSIRADIESKLTNKISHNLSPAEHKAINTLRLKAITIRPCDKGAGICILNDTDYELKCMKLLNVRTDYIPLDIDPTIEIYQAANKLLMKFVDIKYITKKEYYTLIDFKPRTARFYGNPKIHKIDYPMRPIVSQVNGPTSHLNIIADAILSKPEAAIPNLLKDTMSLLQRILPLTVPPGAILVSLDVTSLYTKIEWEEGITLVGEWVTECANHYGYTQVPPTLLAELMRFILSNNAFEFKKLIFQQVFGTAMGAGFAVKYANIYMHKLWKKFMAQSKLTPYFDARLIDDIFLIWQHSEPELQNFFTFLNSQHPHIKFEMNYSTQQINFLDTVIYITPDQKLHTKAYTKPTDRQAYLHYNSSHPKHVKKSIPYSQALRFRRITTNDEILVAQLDTLKQVFINRGYYANFIDTEFKKTNKFSQRDLVQYKIKPTMSRTPLVLPYTPGLDNLGAIIKKLWYKKIASDAILGPLFDEHPIVAFSRTKALRDLLTSSKYPQPWKESHRHDLNSTAYLLCELATE